MALGALSLSVTSGVQGRPFQAKINGLTTGKVEVLNDGAPGFSTVNGNVMSSGLPYPVSTVVLREYDPGVGDGYRDSRIEISAATRADIFAVAAASVSPGRTLVRSRVAGARQADGSYSYSVIAEDDLGATANVPLGGAVLPLVGLSDVTLRVNNSGRYLDCGTLAIPAGDWVSHMAIKLPTSGNAEQPLFSLGNQSDNIASASGAMTLTYFAQNSSNAVDPARGCLVLTGRDDAGNWLNPFSGRTSTIYGASARYLSGPKLNVTGDGISKSVFIQKKGARISLWVVDPGAVALEHDFVAASTFGAIAGKPLWIGRHNRVTNALGFNVGYQRFFMAAGETLTDKQMEAIAQGVDPRQYLSFAGAGSRLLAWQDATTVTQPDLIGGGTTTLSGGAVSGFSADAPLIPTSVDAEQPRANLTGWGTVRQRSGVSSTLDLDGRVTGADDDIYAQVVDFTTKATVVTAWQKIGRSLNGAWSGKMTGVPSALQWYDLQIRKGVSGSVYTLGRRFGIGIVLDWGGQSIAETMRTGGSSTITGAAAGFVSFYSRSKSDNGAGQGQTARGWNRSNSGAYGDCKVGQAIAEGANCVVGVAMSAVQGSTITVWNDPAGHAYADALLTWKEIKPGYLFWEQGHGNLASTYSFYQGALDQLYALWRTDMPWSWQFGMMPLCNAGGSNNQGAAFDNIRRAQIDWSVAKAVGDTRISLVGSFSDSALVDTVHPTSDLKGHARQADRFAWHILFKEGIKATSAVGPSVKAAAWSGATVDVEVQHNGGTDIQVPYAGNITGFDASIDGFTTTLTINSAVRLDATHVRLTLSATPASAPAVRYGFGMPGQSGTLDANGFIVGISNPLYDNRAPYWNPTLGIPLMPTTTAVQAVAA